VDDVVSDLLATPHGGTLCVLLDEVSLHGRLVWCIFVLGKRVLLGQGTGTLRGRVEEGG
jgi:hypothetical protein